MLIRERVTSRFLKVLWTKSHWNRKKFDLFSVITSLCKTFALAIDPLTLVLWFGWGRIWSRFSRCCSIVLGLRWARVKGKTMGNNEDGRMGLFFSSCPHPRLSFFSQFLTLSCWDGIEIGKVLLRLQSTRFFCIRWNPGVLTWEKCNFDNDDDGNLVMKVLRSMRETMGRMMLNMVLIHNM